MQRLPVMYIPHLFIMIDLISKAFDVLFIMVLNVFLRGGKGKAVFEVVVWNGLRNVIFGMHISILTVMPI